MHLGAPRAVSDGVRQRLILGLVTLTAAKVQLTIRITFVMHWQEDRQCDSIGLSTFSSWIL